MVDHMIAKQKAEEINALVDNVHLNFPESIGTIKYLEGNIK